MSHDEANLPVALDPSSLVVLFEDNHVIAVYKPPGVLSQGDSTGRDSMLEITRLWIKEKYQKPGNVYLGLLHRLDRPVAGVLIFAKTSKAASRLSDQFRKRTTAKTYWAWIEGTTAAAGELRHHLDWDEATRRATVVQAPAGKAADLTYRRLKIVENRTLVEVALGTGRKHQIRVQFAAIGKPILGDKNYGSKFASPVSGIALLAYRLTFAHPVKTETRITVEVPASVLEASGWRA